MQWSPFFKCTLKVINKKTLEICWPAARAEQSRLYRQSCGKNRYQQNKSGSKVMQKQMWDFFFFYFSYCSCYFLIKMYISRWGLAACIIEACSALGFAKGSWVWGGDSSCLKTGWVSARPALSHLLGLIHSLPPSSTLPNVVMKSQSYHIAVLYDNYYPFSIYLLEMWSYFVNATFRDVVCSLAGIQLRLVAVYIKQLM